MTFCDTKMASRLLAVQKRMKLITEGMDIEHLSVVTQPTHKCHQNLNKFRPDLSISSAGEIQNNSRRRHDAHRWYSYKAT